MPVASVMPEDKYSFSPLPTSGEFKDVRTFAQQLKHLAANNYLMAAFILGRKGSAELNNETGPVSIRTKTEIIEYLRSSFVALHNAVATIASCFGHATAGPDPFAPAPLPAFLALTS